MIASAPADDEFYIGYEGAMPPRTRRRVRRGLALAGTVVALALSAVLAAISRLPPSRFEFGIVSEVRGTLRRVPYPVLEDERGSVWLVGTGKHGAGAALADLPDGPVVVRGQRIERGRERMLEVIDARRASDEGSLEPDPQPRGRLVTLRGELVDSKCFLGVMNPSEGAVHRDCARRCLSGGIPPMLLVRHADGREQLVVLVSADGGTVSPALAAVAGVPVEVTGRLSRTGTTYLLFVDAWKRP